MKIAPPLIKNPILTRTTFVLLSYLARFGFQGITFILIARALGAEEFGAFTAVLAVATFLSPFVELGAYTLVIRDITTGSPLRQVVGRNLALIKISLPFGLLVALVLKVILLPLVSWSLFLSISLAIFLGGRLQVISSAANIAKGLVARNTVIEVLGGLLQNILALFLLIREGTLELWGWMYAVQYIVIGIVALLWATKEDGISIDRFDTKRVVEGINFATANSASGAYNDMDKALLQRFADLESTGIYAAGFRVIGMAALPMIALLTTVAPKFFERGSVSPKLALNFALRLYRWTILYGLLALTTIWICSPWVGMILGSDFAASSDVLRLLAAYVLLQGLQYPLADALTASGFQSKRTTGQALALAINLCLNLWLIPRFQWQGAAIAALLTQIWLVGFFGLTWWFICRKQGLTK